MWWYVLAYVIGLLVMVGIAEARGWIWDEMEGCLTLFAVLFWPIVLPCLILYVVAKFFISIGKILGGTH